MSVQEFYALCQQKFAEARAKNNDKGPNARFIDPKKGQVHLHLKNGVFFVSINEEAKLWVSPSASGPSPFGHHTQLEGEASIAKALQHLRAALLMPNKQRIFAHKAKDKSGKDALSIAYFKIGPTGRTYEFCVYLRSDQNSAPYMNMAGGAPQPDLAAWWRLVDRGEILDITDGIKASSKLWRWNCKKNTSFIVAVSGERLYLQANPPHRFTYHEALALGGRDLRKRVYE